MRLYLILFLAGLAVLSIAAMAETPAILVEEQAREVWGPELPERADIHVRVAEPAPTEAVMLSAFWMDRSTGRFLANAVTETGETRRIQGLAMVTVNVPVPTRRMMTGEIVTDADFVTKDLPIRRVSAFAVTNPGDLVGMEVRRMLVQGRQVMVQSISEPIIVDRGDKVSILYEDGGIVLTAPGRALDNAHRGQEVRIVNLVSNRSLRAIAREEGLVEVIR